jgi:hypothetical protein
MHLVVTQKRKNGIPKNAKNEKNENMAGSVWLSLFIDDTGMRKLLSKQKTTF